MNSGPGYHTKGPGWFYIVDEWLGLGVTNTDGSKQVLQSQANWATAIGMNGNANG